MPSWGAKADVRTLPKHSFNYFDVSEPFPIARNDLTGYEFRMGNREFMDLFAGCGGLSLGLPKAGWQGVFAVEKTVDAGRVCVSSGGYLNATCHQSIR